MVATATEDRHATRGRRAAVSAALDVMLTDAALDHGGRSRFVQPSAAAKVVGGLARHPDRLGRGLGGLASEFARVAAGRSELVPPKGDRRFGDRGWQENWLLRRVMQAYLAVGDTVDDLISEADLGWQAERQAHLAAENVLDALSPTNFPWSNPAVLKEIVDTGGANLITGVRRFGRDISHGRLPATVDKSNFEVGVNLAASPGSVVLHTDLFELIQYQPQTKQVRELPLLIVPPTINKYYVLDLAPGRSLVEHLVAHGQQVFMMSWRNPDAAQSHFDLDAYADAVLEARAAVAEIAAQQAVHIAAACSGGIISAGALGHLVGDGRRSDVSSLTLLVCALDNARAGTVAALTTRQVAAAAVAESARKGYLDGSALAGVFAWLRPNDLIWGYVVNNYLLGKDPPAFDILYWNQDTVRVAAGLHRDFIGLALDNSITKPGALTVLGTRVDLGAIDLDTYIVAGSNDHIVPWANSYSSTQLLGGESRFVLSTSGHIQALVNPPGPESRSSYRIAEGNPADSDDWLAQAVQRKGSWWPDYVEWLQARSGDLKPAAKRLGSRAHRAAAKAPGIYIHAG
jgi:polyhydroxyalkanoate synthase subunit PhaC